MNYNKSGAGAFFLILIIIVIGSTCVVLAASLQTDRVAELLKMTDAEKGEAKILNILFVVEDEKREMLFSNLVMYYPQNGSAAQINIPAQTADVFQSLSRGEKKGRMDSIDAVYNERGIEAFSSEVGKILGLGDGILFTVTISSENLVRLSDLLGGLKLSVSESVDASVNGERYLLPKGSLLLDGDKVSAYLNYKLETENDAAIYERYQNVMRALLIAIKDRGSVVLSRKTFKRFLDCITVNIKEDDAYSLFKYISGVNTQSIARRDIDGIIRVDNNSKRLLRPLNNGDDIKQVIKNTKSMIVSGGRAYVLEIQNGTDRNGLAANTRKMFENAGYEVIAVDNADTSDYTKTIIINHKGDVDAALLVGDVIGCSNIVEVEGQNMSNNKDFTIILGQDFNGRYVR